MCAYPFCSWAFSLAFTLDPCCRPPSKASQRSLWLVFRSLQLTQALGESPIGQVNSLNFTKPLLNHDSPFEIKQHIKGYCLALKFENAFPFILIQQRTRDRVNKPKRRAPMWERAARWVSVGSCQTLQYRHQEQGEAAGAGVKGLGSRVNQPGCMPCLYHPYPSHLRQLT